MKVRVVSFYTAGIGTNLGAPYLNAEGKEVAGFDTTHVRVCVLKANDGTIMETSCHFECWLSVGQVFPFRTDGNFIWVPFSY
jgi:hypothetical protein